MSTKKTDSEQFLFDFQSTSNTPDPVASWRENRAKETAAICDRLGVPLGSDVEVELISGLLLRGVLHLAEEGLWNEVDRKKVLLEIDGVKFGLTEVGSVVRR